MKNLKLYAATLAFPLISNFAFAANPSSIAGQWIEKFPNGNGMVTEFTAKTISSYSVDASGKQTSPSHPMNVTYRDLGDSSIGVDFEGGSGIMILVKTPNSIVLDFPGMGAHQLVRRTSQQ